MVINAGIIGFSEGNGHPYSFSSIVNGYNKSAYEETKWRNISEYLGKKDNADFGVPGLKINAVWTQDFLESKRIAKCSNIEHVCEHYEDLVNLCDAIILARDDWQSHYEIATFFLERGKYVFVDKPLTLSLTELIGFQKHLNSGRLMSCAALRYAIEFDEFRFFCSNNDIEFIHGTIVASWEKYGVHILDGIFSGIEYDIKSIYLSGNRTKTAILTRQDERQIIISCIGNCAKTFNITAFSESEKLSCEMSDNFSAFKRTLSNFSASIAKKRPVIPPETTVNIMKTLIAGNISLKESRLVNINEIKI